VILGVAAFQGETARDEDAMAGPWWRLRCHIVDAEGETIDHREQGWRDCGEQRGPRHAALLCIVVNTPSVPSCTYHPCDPESTVVLVLNVQ